MADAEIRFRAVLQDDASRGIDALDNKVQASGNKAAEANRRIGQSAATAARETGTAATKMSQAYGAVETAVKRSAANIGSQLAGTRVEQTFQKWKRGLQDFHSGFKDAAAASSAFTGQMAQHGAKVRQAWDTVSGSVQKIAGHARTAASGVASAFGSMGGAISSAASAGAAIGGKLKDGIMSRVNEAKAEVGERLKEIGKGAALAVGVGVGAVVGSAIKGAAELEQTMGATQAVFKENAGQMIAWSNTAARTAGLSKVEYQSFATVLGSSLKNGGMALDEASVKTNDLIMVGADMASMFGGTTKDALTALAATLRGEYDPIERYGVGLTAAKVEAEALAMGSQKVNGELTTQGKQAAILSLIMKQTADAQGNFARETGTLMGATQILRAEWSNFATAIASFVVPILADLVVWISDRLMPKIDALRNGWGAFMMFLQHGSEADWGVLEGFDLTMQNLGLALHNAGVKIGEFWSKGEPVFRWVGQNKDVFGTLALGIGIAATAMGALTAATWLLNAALVVAFSPVVIVGLFIGALILAYNKLGWFKDWVNSTWATIKVGAEAVGKAIVWAWENAVTNGKAIWSSLSGTVTAVIDGIKAAWNGITTFFSDLWNGITTLTINAVSRLVSTWDGFVAGTRTAWAAVQLAVSTVTDWFASTARAAWDTAVRAVGAVFTWLKDNIITPVWNGIKTVIAVAAGVVMTVFDLMKFGVENVLAPAFQWLQRTVIEPVWNAIRARIQQVADWWNGTVVPLYQRTIQTVQTAWAAFRVLVEQVWTAIRNAIQTAWNFIQNSILTPAINFIRGAFTAAWNFIRDTINTVWTAIRTTSTNAWNFLRTSVFQPTIDFIRGAFNSAWTWIREAINTVWTGIRTASTNAWNFLRDSVFNPVINFIRGAFNAAWTWIKDQITARWSDTRNTSSSAWNFLRDSVFNPIINFIRTPFINAWNFLRDGATNAWNAVRDRLSSGWNTIRTTVFDPLVRFVKETIPNAFGAAREAIGRAWDGVKSKIITPINTAVGVIKNVLIGNINSALRKFNLPTIDIAWAGDFSGGSGGSFREGGYTGPGHPGAPAGVVHRDEQVIPSPARRSMEAAYPGLLDRMTRMGAAALSNGAAAPGAPVYNGVSRSFSGGLTEQVFRAGTLNVSGSAPGYDLAGAIRMLDGATKVKVQSGSGAPNVGVSAGPISEWWAGYFDGRGIRINTNVASGLSAPSKRILVAHEIGHALGLPHSDPSGLQSMMSYANMYQHNSVTAADVAALSAIYGGTGFASGGGSGIDIIGLVTKGVEKAFDAIGGSGVGRDLAIGAGKWLFGQAKKWAADGLTKLIGDRQPVEGAAAGYARRGMVIPGYGPGRDNFPIMASRGEAVLTPQLVRALGPGNIQAANLAATGNRAGGAGRAVSLLGRGGAGGVVINVELSVTIEGSADMDAIDRLEKDLEPMLVRILERENRRGY